MYKSNNNVSKKEEPYCLEWKEETNEIVDKTCKDGYKLNNECTCIETAWHKFKRDFGESQNNIQHIYHKF